jgi:two-component system sensor histidine kinase MtrB
VDTPSRRLFPRFRLRTRVIGAFTLGGLILAGLLVSVTYGLGRGTLLRQREDSSAEQFFINAQTVQTSLQGDPNFNEILQSLPSLASSRPLVIVDGVTNSPSVAERLIPDALIEAILASDKAQEMRITDQDDDPQWVLGIRLAGPSEVLYLEVVPLVEINDTLQGLGTVLLIAYGVTVLAGAAIGVWAGSRLLRPLEGIGEAARAIAQGQFDTRVEGIDDPDLAGIVNSFNEMASAMQERIARDSRFASDVSHELRSPLMTIRASVDVMNNRSDELSDRSSAALRLLSDDIDRFERMVQDLLDISRSDSGAIEMHPVNIPELVRAAVAQHAVGDPEITVDEGAERAMVLGDKRRLAQVVTNFLGNADRYAGGATLVEVRDGGTFVLIAVEDEGPGVSPAERELVFERFARGIAARKRGSGDGTGLGLALVYEHVRRHRGRTWVEPRPDGRRGARFVVELPKAGQS